MQRWRQLTAKYFRRTLTSSLLFHFPCSPAHLAFNPSMKTRPDLLCMCLDHTQMICGQFAQFALLTSFSRSNDERVESIRWSPPSLIKFWAQGGDEWKCRCDRRLQHSLCGVSLCVRPEGQCPLSKSCIWSFPTGTDMTTCPCTGTCSAVGPSDRSNTCSRNKPTQFLPSYNLREPPSVFTILNRHTLLWQTTEIYSINLGIKRPNLKQNLAEMMHSWVSLRVFF